MAKAITLVRVSTTHQTYDEQSREVYNMALNDGFQDDSIIQIEEKESGYLDIDDRRGLTRLKEIIDNSANGEITCVYAWEVSRVARRKKVGFSILEYLINKKINLKILKPTICLFNADGTINDGMELIFTMFLHIAESERRMIMERTYRTLHKMKEEGKCINGRAMFGYYVDENKYAKVDEEKAEIVRLMFRMYTENKPMATILGQLEALGYKSNPSQVRKRLKFPYDGSTQKYPQIVNKELYDKAQEILAKRSGEYVTKKIYYSKGILRCGECNRLLNTNGALNTYKCGNHFPRCYTYSVSLIDSLLWHVAKKLYCGEQEELYNITESDYKQQKKVFQKSITNLNASLKRYAEKLNELDENYFIDGNLTKEKYQALVKKIHAKINETNKEIAHYNNKLVMLETEYIAHKEKNYNLINLDVLNNGERKAIIDSVIDVVYATREKNIAHIVIHTKSFKTINVTIDGFKRSYASTDIDLDGIEIIHKPKEEW